MLGANILSAGPAQPERKLLAFHPNLVTLNQVNLYWFPPTSVERGKRALLMTSPPPRPRPSTAEGSGAALPSADNGLNCYM